MFDIEAEEKGSPRRIFYNFRDAAIESATATSAIQIAFWVLVENGAEIPLRALQYVDLKNGKVYTIGRQSQKTVRLMRANARIIATLWPTI